MKSTLEAAEALLGTVEAARAHLRLIANQNLSLEDSLAFGAESRVGASPERALLHVATISLDLARVASSLHPGAAGVAPPAVAPPAQPPAEAAAHPAAARPETSPEDEDTAVADQAALRRRIGAPPPDPAADALDEPTTLADRSAVDAALALAADDSDPTEQAEPEPAPPAASVTEPACHAEPAPAAPEVVEPEVTMVGMPDATLQAALTSADQASGAPAASTDAVTLDDLVHDSLPEPTLAPWQRALQEEPEPAETTFPGIDLAEGPRDHGGQEAGAQAGQAALDDDTPTAIGQIPAAIRALRDQQAAAPASGGAFSRFEPSFDDVPDPAAAGDLGAHSQEPVYEADTTNIDPTPEAGPTTVATMSPELVAAISRPRSVNPATGQTHDDRAEQNTGERWAAVTTHADRPIYDTPELVERDGLAEPTAVAAVQILGVGSARTLSPTLELGGDEDDAVHLPDPGDADDLGSGLHVDFEEPDEPEQETGSVPELTADQGSHYEDVIVTRDGVQHKDGARVADADVDKQQITDLLTAAEAAEQRGNLQEAVLHYGDLLSLQPSHAAAHLGRGRCLVELGDYGAAMSDFQRAEDLQPDAPQPLMEMGNLFYARKEYTKAIEYYSQAIDLAPEFAMAWVRRGMCHQYKKEHQQAFTDLQKAASLDPDIPNVRLYVDMARKAMGKGR